MKKVIIFLLIIVGLFSALFFINKAQNEEKAEGNPYGKETLHPETVKQLEDPNYQNIITPDDLDKIIKNGEDATVYFYSPTCPHCVRTTPVLAPLAKEMNVNMLQFNLLEYENGWNDYGIESTPTLVQYKDGKEVNRIVGYQEEPTFEEWLNENSLK
ncbi:thioredoxin family protein [Mesobacillus subterraneus]|uniref:thioredoxin family protein n=1 Tax=Mesobacillus subterraneus TaxID=285983 RepID=UPI00203C0D8A|nr:thioredoxin family protein [Mesobacillus subterraneus]MCM3662833.1 thioredoxin family protein [Mesobacillus subterraneus]MCM3682991.1 thioredoxin family protein [Mesobacillus subterraneus]